MTTLIFAPHIDDEMIGCWSVITDPKRKVTVVYFHELTEERRIEACRAADKHDFNVLFSDKLLTPEWINTFEHVYVPSRRDWHADHQAVNAKYRSYATHFYSVDMARGIVLSDAAAKRLALDYAYPSQRSLWAHDDKYWLFEDIQTTDYDVYTKVCLGGVVCTVLEQYSQGVANLWYRNTFSSRLRRLDQSAINEILSICVSGKVTIDYDNTIIEAQ